MKSWSFTQFIRELEQHGFTLERTRGASRIYKGVVDGKVRLVSVHYHRGDIKPGTLASMIRQSGLSKKLFR